MIVRRPALAARNVQAKGLTAKMIGTDAANNKTKIPVTNQRLMLDLQ